MANRKELKIIIGKDGKIEIGVQGVNGPECLKTTSFLTDSIGTVIDQQKTSDFYKENESVSTYNQTGEGNNG